MDKTKFMNAMVYCFLSKGKDEPKPKMVEVWYQELRRYDEEKVMDAFKTVSGKQTYGIQVADIIAIINPPRDFEIEGAEVWENIIHRITNGTPPDKTLFDGGQLTWNMYSELKSTTSDFVRSQIKKQFLNQYAKVMRGELIQGEENKQVKIGAKEENVIQTAIPNKNEGQTHG